VSAQHLPGPWTVSPSNELRITTTTNGRTYVASCDNIGMPSAPYNARLIAAAPELLAALELARNTFAGIGMVTIASAICDAAIAKATGK